MRKILFYLPYPNTPQQRKDFIRRFGLNAYWSGKHWSERKEDADYWHWLVHACLVKQKVPRKTFEKPVEIRFLWNDGLDIDNHAAMAKMIVDALKGWVIENDSKKYYRRCVHDFHTEPHIKIEVEEIEGSKHDS